MRLSKTSHLPEGSLTLSFGFTLVVVEGKVIALKIRLVSAWVNLTSFFQENMFCFVQSIKNKRHDERINMVDPNSVSQTYFRLISTGVCRKH